MSMAPSQLGAFAQVRPEPRHAQPRVPRAAALAAHVRRAAAPVPGLHRQRLQPEPDQPRQGAHHRAATPRRRPRSRRTTSPPTKTGRVAADALRVTRRIVAAAGAGEVPAARSSARASQFQSDEELAQAAGDIGTTIFHPVGTCKMGRDDTAVVDPRLRCTGSPACASSTPASCRPSPAATPTRRR